MSFLKILPQILEKSNIKAIHDEDLEDYLKKLGQLKKIKRGKVKCYFCGEQITLKNLHSIFPLSGDIKFVCDKKECIKKLSKLLDDGKVPL